MKVSVIATVGDIAGESLLNKSVVMFDILRACSTISTALANGCKEVIPVIDVDDAYALAKQLPEGSYLLGGERGAVKLPGFHLGNSPLDYTEDLVRDKTIILTTTNGTKATRLAAGENGRVIIGSLLNCASVAKVLAKQNQDILLVCAGTRGKFSLEDTLAAGMVIKELVNLQQKLPTHNVDKLSSAHEESFYLEEIPLTNENSLLLGDTAVAALRLAEYYYKKPVQALYDSLHGQKLVQMGLTPDMEYCAKVNLFNNVPVFMNGKIVIVADLI